MRVWLLACLAACYSPHAETGAPCTPSAPVCPSDQMCVTSGSGSFCETGPALPDAGSGATTDGDGDGVPDAQDNCPTKANTDQHDEDADGLGDVCDPCPPSSNNADGDADGVGDDCDPHPSTAGDKIAVFEGFGDGIPMSWVKTGTWMAMNDDIIASTMAGGLATLMRPSVSDHESVSVGVTPTATVGTGYREIGVNDVFAPAFGTTIVCTALITSATDATPNAPMADLFTVPSGSAIDRMAWTWQLNDRMVVSQTRAGMGYSCDAYDFTANTSGHAAGTSVFGAAAPYAGIHVASATATVHWFMIVTSP